MHLGYGNPVRAAPSTRLFARGPPPLDGDAAGDRVTVFRSARALFQEQQQQQRQRRASR